MKSETDNRFNIPTDNLVAGGPPSKKELSQLKEAGVTRENARELDELLQDGEKVFLHCALGNRVDALLAIRAHEIEGKNLDQSLEFGRAAWDPGKMSVSLRLASKGRTCFVAA